MAVTNEFNIFHCGRHGGLLWLAKLLDSGLKGPGSSPGQVIVLCSWARHFTLTVPLSTRSTSTGTGKLSGKPDEMLGVTCDRLVSHLVGVAILLII